ncbi:protein PLASTID TRANSCRIPTIONALLY ACTIVE 14 isoform X1 [Dendrobium catenatum]|uniref:protein PLASTID TRANSCRIPTIONALLY ACTIVE 14 isoform X1 n=1 Tax=Dendrobium catenatum TaxID=906689 RepID=UPI0010A060A6|nr:protein PLASTID TRANSCRIPTIONALLY ACTIVE 14 isoform X1 [Dendrobium catenatum]
MASHLALTLSSALLFSNPKPRTVDLTRQSPLGRTSRKDIPSASASSSLPPFKLFEPQQVDESPFPPDLEPADPDFYKIGYARSVRAYGVDFMEGPNGFGVYASRDVEPLRRARPRTVDLTRQSPLGRTSRKDIPSASASSSLPPFKLFEPQQVDESPFPPDLEPADPDFYKIGYARSVRAYGVDFMEGPNGFGVYASRDVEPLRRARMIMEIPLELMLTISQKHPWMFYPDIVPIGHPIFDIINSTDPETDWDLRLACLLLFAFDVEGNFWQLYGDFLPSADECTSLLLAEKEDLLELQDPVLASKMEQHIQRAIEFWEKNWHSSAPLKIKRLSQDPERFLWALSIAQSRSLSMKIRIGALVQNTNMLVPYADMLNHSFQPNCFFHWRFKDRMLEVMINAGQRIKKGDEVAS